MPDFTIQLKETKSAANLTEISHQITLNTTMIYDTRVQSHHQAKRKEENQLLQELQEKAINLKGPLFLVNQVM